MAWLPGSLPGQQSVPPLEQRSSAAPFAHLPLLYEGPDPVANNFLPFVRPEAEDSPRTFLPPSYPMLYGPPEFFADPSSLPHLDSAQLEDGSNFEAFGKLSEHKDGFFQKLSFSYAWIDRGEAMGFGISELDLSAMFALPLPTREWPLVLSPAFNVRFLEGPRSPDLPSRLYETYLDFLWLPRLGPRWTVIVSAAPSIYSDFVVDEQEAFRWTGRGLARFDWVPERVQVLLGVLYLNRVDVRLLPAGGIIWTPSDDRRYELVFPRPKLAHRILVGDALEDWVYLSAEFGGNSWAMDRGGVADMITFRDYRVFFGLERKRNGGAGHRIEIGYVFSRRAEFSSDEFEIHAPATALLRFGIAF